MYGSASASVAAVCLKLFSILPFIEKSNAIIMLLCQLF
jgi:hypothetical protein